MWYNDDDGGDGGSSSGSGDYELWPSHVYTKLSIQ